MQTNHQQLKCKHRSVEQSMNHDNRQIVVGSVKDDSQNDGKRNQSKPVNQAMNGTEAPRNNRDRVTGRHHPTQKTELSKLNPLQRLVYLGFKIILIPITVGSGIFYMLYKTFDQNNLIVIEDYPLASIAFWHTLGAILLMIFL